MKKQVLIVFVGVVVCALGVWQGLGAMGQVLKDNLDGNANRVVLIGKNDDAAEWVNPSQEEITAHVGSDPLTIGLRDSLFGDPKRTLYVAREIAWRADYIRDNWDEVKDNTEVNLSDIPADYLRDHWKEIRDKMNRPHIFTYERDVLIETFQMLRLNNSFCISVMLKQSKLVMWILPFAGRIGARKIFVAQANLMCLGQLYSLRDAITDNHIDRIDERLKTISQMIEKKHKCSIPPDDFVNMAHVRFDTCGVFCGEGWTLLHQAAEYGSLACVRLLLDKGAQVNARDFDLNTPLHYAAKKGRADVVQELFVRGAISKAKNSAGKTPAMLATENGYLELAKSMKSAFKGLVNHQEHRRRDRVTGRLVPILLKKRELF